MTDLDKLIEAVECGGSYIDFPARNGLNDVQDSRAHRAYNGSLDAAKALHEAMLPHLRAGVMTDGSCQMFNEHGVEIGPECCSDANPARAWLLSILKAYRSQQ